MLQPCATERAAAWCTNAAVRERSRQRSSQPVQGQYEAEIAPWIDENDFNRPLSWQGGQMRLPSTGLKTNELGKGEVLEKKNVDGFFLSGVFFLLLASFLSVAWATKFHSPQWPPLWSFKPPLLRKVVRINLFLWFLGFVLCSSTSHAHKPEFCSFSPVLTDLCVFLPSCVPWLVDFGTAI